MRKYDGCHKIHKKLEILDSKGHRPSLTNIGLSKYNLYTLRPVWYEVEVSEITNQDEWP